MGRFGSNRHGFTAVYMQMLDPNSTVAQLTGDRVLRRPYAVPFAWLLLALCGLWAIKRQQKHAKTLWI